MSYTPRDDTSLVESANNLPNFRGISLRTPWEVKRLALSSLIAFAISLMILVFVLAFSIPAVLFTLFVGGPYLIWTAWIYLSVQKLDTQNEAGESKEQVYLKVTEVFAIFAMISLLFWSCILLWLGFFWVFALDARAYLPMLGIYALILAVSFFRRRRDVIWDMNRTPNAWENLWTLISMSLYGLAAAMGTGLGMVLPETIGYEKTYLIIGFGCIAVAFLFIPGTTANWAQWRVLRTRPPELNGHEMTSPHKK